MKQIPIKSKSANSIKLNRNLKNYYLLKFLSVLIITSFLFSCNRIKEPPERIGAESSRRIKTQDITAIDPKPTKQDSVELVAIKGFYFGKLHNEKQFEEKLEIAGVEFHYVSYNGFSWQFGHFIEDNKENYKSKLDDLVKVVNYKFGTPKLINTKKTGFNLFGTPINHPQKSVMTDKYIWHDKYKNILVGIIETVDRIEYITFRIVNLKLESEYDLKNKKEKEEAIRKESEKL